MPGFKSYPDYYYNQQATGQGKGKRSADPEARQYHVSLVHPYRYVSEVSCNNGIAINIDLFTETLPTTGILIITLMATPSI